MKFKQDAPSSSTEVTWAVEHGCLFIRDGVFNQEAVLSAEEATKLYHWLVENLVDGDEDDSGDNTYT